MSTARLVDLTELLGRAVQSDDGQIRGHVDDLTVRLGDSPATVDRILVRRHGDRWLVPWSSSQMDGKDTAVTEPPWDSRPSHDLPKRNIVDLHSDELLLRRDVLDCQIVDLGGRRLTRASDVVLSGSADGDLVLVGVEIGLGALLRRLGLRRLSRHQPRRIVPMDQLHLTSSRGHQVQLTAATSAMHQLDAVGLAHLLTRLEVGKATEVLATVGPERAASALLQTHPEVGRRLIAALPAEDSSRIRGRLGHSSRTTHPHLHDRMPMFRRRSRRLAGWRTHHPPDSLS